jgi:hypothetical protein
MAYIKQFLKKLKAELDDRKSYRTDSFMKGSSEFIKFINPKFEEVDL